MAIAKKSADSPTELSSSSLRLLLGLESEDTRSWNLMVERYAPGVYRRCRNSGLGVQDAEDVTQEVFVAIARSLGSFEPDAGRGSLARWISVIATNKLRDHWRRWFRQRLATGGTTWRMRIEAVEERFEGSSTFSIGTNEDDVRVELVARIRAETSARDWAIFERVLVDDRSAGEVAEEFSVTANVVYLVRSRILRRFQQELNSED